MKRVIRIDEATGEVTVEPGKYGGVLLHINLGQFTMSFAMGFVDALNLGEALVKASEEQDRGRLTT